LRRIGPTETARIAAAQPGLPRRSRGSAEVILQGPEVLEVHDAVGVGLAGGGCVPAPGWWFRSTTFLG